jgi:hypothetical protein
MRYVNPGWVDDKLPRECAPSLYRHGSRFVLIGFDNFR